MGFQHKLFYDSGSSFKWARGLVALPHQYRLSFMNQTPTAPIQFPTPTPQAPTHQVQLA